MASEDKNVFIKSWPDEPAKLNHQFESGTSCPVAVSFESDPANVKIDTSVDDPIHVDMGMHLKAEKPLPVCITLCDPLCAKSEYEIGIRIFDRPVVTITVRGKTVLFRQLED